MGLSSSRKAYRVLTTDNTVTEVRAEDVIFPRWSAPAKFTASASSESSQCVDGEEEEYMIEEEESSTVETAEPDGKKKRRNTKRQQKRKNNRSKKGAQKSTDSSSGEDDSSSDSSSSEPVGNSSDEEEEEKEEPGIAQRRPARQATASRKVRDIKEGHSVATVNGGEYFHEYTPDPNTRSEAMSSADRTGWMKGEQTELEAHRINGTWEVVTEVDTGSGMPPGAAERGAVLVNSKYVYKTKRNLDGTVKTHKVRLCAQEFKDYGKKKAERIQRTKTETMGTGDYDDDVDLYAPVASKDALRLILATAAREGLEVSKLDVKTAYINAEMTREVYMRVPEGMDVPEGSVLRLKKCLYGLRTSGNRWNDLLNQEIEDMGYTRANSDPCVYVKNDEGDLTFVAVTVDDILIATGSGGAEHRRILKHMQEKYKMTDEGLLDYYCGIEVTQTADGIFLGQRKYTADILERFGMTDCKPVATPSDTHTIFEKGDDSGQNNGDNDESVDYPYQEAIGALLYLVVNTRPDIAEAVGNLGQFAKNPTAVHCNGVKRIFRYLKGSSEHGIFYSAKEYDDNSGDGNIVAYSDANYAECRDSRRSVSGHVVFLAGGPVMWGSRKQKCVTLSTMEAEYIALSDTAVEVRWARNLLGELEYEQDGPTQIFGDNVAANILTKRPGITRKAKHIEVKYHHIRECVVEGVVRVDHVPTEHNIADIFTKALARDRFNYLREQMVSSGKGN